MTQAPAMALDALLIITLCVAAVTDIRSRRISNRLTYSAVAAGMALHLALGWGSLASSILGCLVGLAVFMLPYALRGMGAGDVKLMAAIGALQGPAFALNTALYAGLAGGLLALGYIAAARLEQGSLRAAFPALSALSAFSVSPVGSDARSCMAGPHERTAGSARGRHAAGTVPYGVAIAVGAAVALLRPIVGAA